MGQALLKRCIVDARLPTSSILERIDHLATILGEVCVQLLLPPKVLKEGRHKALVAGLEFGIPNPYAVSAVQPEVIPASKPNEFNYEA